MFERFSDQARKAMAYANQEAQRLNHDYIGTEHIVLGLVRVESCIATTLLLKHGVESRRIRIEVEKLSKLGPEMITMGKLPKTPRAKRVIEYAIEEARKLNQASVTTAHILLGILREEDGVGAHVLRGLDVTLETARADLAKMGTTELEETNPPPMSPPGPGSHPQFERFTDRAKKTLALANQEAQRLNHRQVDSGHILVGLLREGSGVGANVLRNLNVDLARTRVALEAECPPLEPQTSYGMLPKAPDAGALIEQSVREARILGHNYIGTEHLLLALAANEQSIAGRVLKSLEISPIHLRSEIINLIGASEKSAAAEGIPTRGQILAAEHTGNLPFSREVLNWLMGQFVHQTLELRRISFRFESSEKEEVEALLKAALDLQAQLRKFISK